MIVATFSPLCQCKCCVKDGQLTHLYSGSLHRFAVCCVTSSFSLVNGITLLFVYVSLNQDNRKVALGLVEMLTKTWDNCIDTRNGRISWLVHNLPQVAILTHDIYLSNPPPSPFIQPLCVWHSIRYIITTNYQSTLLWSLPLFTTPHTMKRYLACLISVLMHTKW